MAKQSAKFGHTFATYIHTIKSHNQLIKKAGFAQCYLAFGCGIQYFLFQNVFLLGYIMFSKQLSLFDFTTFLIWQNLNKNRQITSEGLIFL